MALPGDFDFDVRYTKGEEKVYVLDRNPWLSKIVDFCTFVYKFVYVTFTRQGVKLQIHSYDIRLLTKVIWTKRTG